MATITYNGVDVESLDTPQVFDPPRDMVTWNYRNGEFCDVAEREVIAILPNVTQHSCVVFKSGISIGYAKYCALLPEKPEPRRATNRELAKWLAQGKGEAKSSPAGRIVASIAYEGGVEDKRVCNSFSVRKWDDTEWHEPTAEYLDLEDRV